MAWDPFTRPPSGAEGFRKQVAIKTIRDALSADHPWWTRPRHDSSRTIGRAHRSLRVDQDFRGAWAKAAQGGRRVRLRYRKILSYHRRSGALVDYGPTRQDRVAQAPITIDDPLPMAKQGCRGVGGRDREAADLGLAKESQREVADPNMSMSPTMWLTAAATETGGHWHRRVYGP